MEERKTLSKKIRFEVFKRDSFKCQYCGKSAPDVILEVDHIKPVAEGRSNDIMNLITACRDCNRGKGKIELKDTDVISKRKAQLDELNERRLQIEMMVDWQEGLLKNEDYEVDKIECFIKKISNIGLTDEDREKIKKYIKRYGFQKVIESVKISFDQYNDNIEKAIKQIPYIIINREKMKEKPYLKDLLYIRGIARNRFRYLDERKSMKLLEECFLRNVSIDELKEFTLKCKNWTEFRTVLEKYIEDYDAKKEEDESKDNEENKGDELNYSKEDIEKIKSDLNIMCMNLLSEITHGIFSDISNLSNEGILTFEKSSINVELNKVKSKDILNLLVDIIMGNFDSLNYQWNIHTIEQNEKVILIPRLTYTMKKKSWKSL